jgi:dihydrofolate reductase
MKVSTMAAMSLNRVIGFKEKLPWGSLPADWAYLYEVTKNKPMIMGRKSYEAEERVSSSAGNIVLSRQPNYSLEDGFIQAESLEKGLEILSDTKSRTLSGLRGQAHDEIFIIGGEQIFRQAIPQLVDRIYLTLVHETFEGDAFFPEFDPSVFLLKSRQDFKADAENRYDYSFLVYEKTNS